MSDVIRLTTPLSDETVKKLRAGDRVLIDGVLYTARDAAHKRLVEAMDKGEPPPFPLAGQIIYYVGPSPARPGRPLGSAGPTTSYRMDPYAPRLMEKGVKGMIGKGKRSEAVLAAIKKFTCVYFAAVGGAGALLAGKIVKSDVIAYDDLGPEAVRMLTVREFPVIVINDCVGGDAYLSGVEKYRRA